MNSFLTVTDATLPQPAVFIATQAIFYSHLVISPNSIENDNSVSSTICVDDCTKFDTHKPNLMTRACELGRCDADYRLSK